MTREKKELFKRMHEIEEYIHADDELSCGCHPDNAYDEMYGLLNELYARMARLCHFDNVMDWMMDDRYMQAHMNRR